MSSNYSTWFLSVEESIICKCADMYGGRTYICEKSRHERTCKCWKVLKCKGRTELKMYQVQFRNRRMPNHKTFHRELSKTDSFHLTRPRLLFMGSSEESCCSHIRSYCKCVWNICHLWKCVPIAPPTLSNMHHYLWMNFEYLL